MAGFFSPGEVQQPGIGQVRNDNKRNYYYIDEATEVEDKEVLTLGPRDVKEVDAIYDPYTQTITKIPADDVPVLGKAGASAVITPDGNLLPEGSRGVPFKLDRLEPSVVTPHDLEDWGWPNPYTGYKWPYEKWDHPSGGTQE